MDLIHRNIAPQRSEHMPNGNTARYIISGGTAYRSGLDRSDGSFDDRCTPPAVIAVLERARLARTPGPLVRLYYGDSDGVSSLFEGFSIGRVGRSAGQTKIPLLISAIDQCAAAIASERVVRIDSQGLTLWHHPGFRLPALIEATGENAAAPFELRDSGGQVVRSFPTAAARLRWLAVMAGDVFPDPKIEAAAWGGY